MLVPLAGNYSEIWILCDVSGPFILLPWAGPRVDFAETIPLFSTFPFPVLLNRFVSREFQWIMHPWIPVLHSASREHDLWIHIHTHTCTHAFAYTQAVTHKYTYVYSCVLIHVCKYTHMYIHMMIILQMVKSNPLKIKKTWSSSHNELIQKLETFYSEGLAIFLNSNCYSINNTSGLLVYGFGELSVYRGSCRFLFCSPERPVVHKETLLCLISVRKENIGNLSWGKSEL